MDADAERLGADSPPDDLLAINDLLDELAWRDRQAADLVKLRYFAGFTVPEAAAAMGISERTVHRDWAFASS